MAAEPQPLHAKVIKYLGQGNRAPQFVYNDQIVSACGNSVCIYSLITGETKLIPTRQNRGICALTTNPKEGMFAYSCFSDQPTIEIMRLTSDAVGSVSEVLTLREGAQVEYACLGISRDCTKVVAVGGCMDYKVTIWDIASCKDGRPISLEKEIFMEKGCSQCSFNPLDDNVFCTSGEQGISFWTIKETFETFALEEVKGKSRMATEEQEDGESVPDKMYCGFRSHCWASDGTVLAVNNLGELVKFETSSGDTLAKINIKAMEEAESPTQNTTISILSISLTQEHIIVACNDGTMRWLNAATCAEEKQEKILAGESLIHDVNHMALSANCTKLIASSPSGTVHIVPTQTSKRPADALKNPVFDNHGNAILGIVPVYSSRKHRSILATVSIDGSFRVWNVENYERIPERKDMLCREVWEFEGRTPPLCSLAASPNFPYLAYGTVTGYLRLIGLEFDNECTSAAVIPVHTSRLFKVPLSGLSFSPNGHFLCAISVQDDKSFVLSANKDTGIKLVAVIPTTCHEKKGVTTCCWKSSRQLLLATQSTIVIVDINEDVLLKSETPIELNPKNFSVVASNNEILSMETLELQQYEPSVLAVSPADTNVHIIGHYESTLSCENHNKGITCVAVRPQKWNKSMVFATGSLDGSVCIWEVAGNGKNVSSSIVNVHCQNKPISSLSFTQDGKYIVAADIGGDIAVIEIFSSEYDPLSYNNMNTNSEPIKKLQMESSVDGNIVLTEYEKIETRKLEKATIEYDKVKQVRKEKIGVLQKRLEALLESNERCPAIEKLDRDEFTIDLNNRKSKLEMAENKADILRTKLTREIRGRDLVSERILVECWESMETKSQKLFALQSGKHVRNFVLPVQSNEASRKMERIVNLRKLELCEIRDANEEETSWRTNVFSRSCPEDIEWVFMAGKLKPILNLGETDEQKTNKTRSTNKLASEDENVEDDEGDQDKEDQDQDEIDEENVNIAEEKQASAGNDSILKLLYHPISLRSPVQKRTQIYLIQMLKRKMMANFNEKFEKLVSAKEDSIESILEKNTRIREILSDLGVAESPFCPTSDPSENPESIISVTDEEVGVERYISKAEQERLDREEEERRRKAEEAAKDNLGERALQDMMNGTLEEKIDLLAVFEQDLVKPDWMIEIPYEDMSEEQKIEFEAFESKEKEIEAEKEKHRKALELELKKLRAEVYEIVKQYDEKLEWLFDIRVKTLENIKAQELYEFRLRNSLLRDEIIRTDQAEIMKKIFSLDEEIDTKRSQLSTFLRRVEQQREVLQKKVDQDKMLERSFRSSIQEVAMNTSGGEALDHDDLKILQQLFRTRAGRHRSLVVDQNSLSRRPSLQKIRGGSVSSFSRSISDSIGEGSIITESVIHEGNDNITLDPFADVKLENKNEKEARQRREALAPLDPQIDIPEGANINDTIWECLQQLRRKKIESEIELKHITDETNLMNEKLDLLQKEFDELQQARINLENESLSIFEKRNSERENIELVISLNQGQDEVESTHVVKDYGNAALVYRNVIERENEKIKILGDQKIATMNKMKDFRKSINYIEWESRYMEMQKYDLQEHYTDLHMLRVTRTLQEKIKTGETNESQEQAAKAESKIVQMKKYHNEKRAKLEKSLQQAEARVKTLAEENKKLDERITDIRTKVAIRQSIQGDHASTDDVLKGSSSPVGSGASAAKARMRGIVTRRKLMDLAKAQMDEIDFLRNELERLRERNFPCFSKKFVKHRGRDALPPDEKVT